MSALLAAQGQSTASATPTATSPASALQSLFSQIDANGDGQITKSEFENALGAGGTNIAQADKVFSQLDTNGDGTVSLGELSSALRGSGGHGHGHAHIDGSGGSGGDTSGSSTDAVPTASSGAASSSYNMIEQMIQREASAISFSTPPLSVNV
jgi:Ca2+-binding EF-hand superfamily protein